jgi:hypothetical protein
LPTIFLQCGHFHHPFGAGDPHLLQNFAAFFTELLQRGHRLKMLSSPFRAFSNASPLNARPVVGSINALHLSANIPIPSLRFLFYKIIMDKIIHINLRPFTV